MSPARAAHKILVVALDPLLAALIGRFAEMARLQVEYPREDERPEQAFARVRPVAVILADAMVSDVRSDLFLTRARRGGADVLLFGSATAIRACLDWASTHHVATFALPDQLDELQRALEQLRAPERREPRRVESRGARDARGARNTAGPLTFSDGHGQRWSVYDRRSADRRRNLVDRRFISDGGEVRQCRITSAEAKRVSAAELSEQLARATVK